jgi:DNA-binding SARP family transcriptional activator
VQVCVLGPLEVVRDGRPVDHGGPKPGALLAALVLHAGSAVSTDVLVDLLWGDRPPRSVTGTLQAYVAGLRRVLEPDRAPRSAATVLLTSGAGYLLRLPPEALDVCRVEQAVTRASALLAPLVQDVTAPPAAVPVGEAGALLTSVAGLWRGVPYEDLGDAPDVVAERARLEQLQVTAAELQALVRLAEGDAAGAAGELERLTRRHPLRERLWALRVLALTRSGRQGDALAALRDVRHLLADELPGPGRRAAAAGGRGPAPGPVAAAGSDAAARHDRARGFRSAGRRPLGRPSLAVGRTGCGARAARGPARAGRAGCAAGGGAGG